jgi:glycosyltransferase involved in cell wall biosynthesis
LTDTSAPSDLVSVVVPCYCEAAGLATAVDAIRGALESSAVAYEIILVDDGSSDGTWACITALRARIGKRVRGIRLSRRFGKESAMRAGLEMARGSAVITMDADLQHPPSLIPAMVECWRRGDVDVVDAVKVERGRESGASRVSASLFYRLFRALTRRDLRNASDFKLLSRKVVTSYLALPEHSLFYRAMVSWLGFRHAEVPFAVDQRNEGTSKWGPLTLLRLALNAVTAHSAAPLHAVTLLGLAFLVLSVALGAQTLYNKIAGNAVSGFTTVILLLLVTGSAIMVALGVIGEYIARIYDEVKGRHRFVIADALPDDAHD